MAGLATVGDYIAEARVLLQDTRVPYRYSDTEMVRGLNIALMEARRLRGDLFLPLFEVPALSETGNPDGTIDDPAKAVMVTMDPMYRSSLVYYVTGRMQLRDEENTTDTRAAALLAKFTSQLLTIQS
jgi:hypothetical protein